MTAPTKCAHGILIRYQTLHDKTLTENRVTDHRGFKYNDLRGCMEGGALQELLDGVAKVVQQMELEEAIAMDADQLSPMGVSG
jgi:hypothetical protein